MPKTFHFELSTEEQIRGPAVIGDWRAGQTVHTFGDNFLGCWALLSSAQLLARVPMVGPDGGFLLGAATIEQVRAASGEEIATAYAAAQNTVRKLVHGAQLMQGPAPPLLGLPSIETALPFGIIAAAVVGIGAVAGATWWGVDRNEKVARVKMHAAEQAAQVDQYIRDLQVRAAAGQPLPAPPPTVKAASYAEQGYTPVQVAVAVALALAAGKGIADGVRRPAPARRNPAPPPRRRRNKQMAFQFDRPPRAKPKPPTRTKAAPKRKPKAKKAPAVRIGPSERQVLAIASNAWKDARGGAGFWEAKQIRAMRSLEKKGYLTVSRHRDKVAGKRGWRGTLTKKGRDYATEQGWGPSFRANKSSTTRATKKTATKRKANPLGAGHSQATISKNIAQLRKEGKPPQVAAAIAMRMARASWRRKHPRGAFPAHLQTAAERAGRKKAAKKTAKKAPAKRNAHKKTAKKANPKAPKGKTPRATFIRAQMRKGRSVKQATADWNGKQRLKKQRSGKGRGRR